MRMRFREIHEIKEDKGERSLPYNPDNQINIKPKNTLEELNALMDLLFADDYEESEVAK